MALRANYSRALTIRMVTVHTNTWKRQRGECVIVRSDGDTLCKTFAGVIALVFKRERILHFILHRQFSSDKTKSEKEREWGRWVFLFVLSECFPTKRPYQKRGLDFYLLTDNGSSRSGSIDWHQPGNRTGNHSLAFNLTFSGSYRSTNRLFYQLFHWWIEKSH